ncbi:hypothetical protein L7F22_058603 [Adiantum nelumboides]|nr:hypothetical protein [Adiantum nelumboides]
MEWVSTAKSSLEVHSTLAELLLLLLAAVSALLLRRRAVLSAAKRPPGPRAWPVIGHLHRLGQLPHQSLCKLAQIYGPLMGLRLGGVHVIVVSSPEMAKEILQTNEQAFLDRPRSTAVIHMYLGGKWVSFEAYGPRWKRMRQLCATELFSAKRLASFRYVREEEVR